MGFEVIPAIDVSEGRLVRMSVGGPAVVRGFGGDPLAAAEAFVAAGASMLHVVDVDLAFSGHPSNVDVVTAIRARFPAVGIQASGGIARRSDVDLFLEVGARRVVVGSAALVELAAVESLLAEFGEAIVIGVETEDGRIRPRGMYRSIDVDLDATVAWIAGTDAAYVLHTNVRRAGELGGPDLAGLRAVMGSGKPVIAAGGISSLDDLRRLAAEGAAGAVVGRALYDGSLDLAAAFAPDLGG